MTDSRRAAPGWLRTATVGAGLFLPIWALLAQAEPQRGPTAAELESYRAQYEARYNQAPTAPESEVEPFQPEFEQPGEIPAEARQYATDAELAQIYCAMTRWKSGDFFASMVAVKKHVWPLYDKAREIEPTIERPDVDGFIAAGEGRVQAICAAATADEADRLTREFISWGQNTVFAEMQNSRRQMADKLNKASESIRTKVEESIKPTIEQKEKDIRASAEAKADQLVAAMQARFEGRTSAPSESELAAAVAEIERGVQSHIAPLITAAETEISTKAQDAVAPEKARFEAIGSLAKDINSKMAAEIQSSKADYYKYRDEAVALRKKIILSYLDKNLAEAMTKLEGARADLASAKAADPAIKDVDEIKALIAADRQALEAKLTAALEKDDEQAVQDALNAFRQKWEDFRANAEKAATVGITKGCDIAKQQFAAARVKIQENTAKIAGVVAPCAASTSEECQTVNEFAPRLGQLDQKLDDLQFGMDMAEKLCQDPDSVDRNELIGVLQQVKTDADDVKIFGEALEADKNKALAETAEQVCARALAQLKAAVKEIDGSDLESLRLNMWRCGDRYGAASKDFPFCADVKANEQKFTRVETMAKSFVGDVESIEKLCKEPGSEDVMERLEAALNRLKYEGDVLRTEAKELRALTEQKMSALVFCRSVTGLLDEMTAGITKGLAELLEIDSKLIKPTCKDQASYDCNKLRDAIGKDVYIEFEHEAQPVLDTIARIRSSCVAAGNSPPDSILVALFTEVGPKAKRLQERAAKVKAGADKLYAGKDTLWIEAEDAVRFNVRTKVSDPMVREVDPLKWRPPYFGNGDWYMGSGGDYLEYDITVVKPGKYKIWVRDLAANIPKQLGMRQFHVSFDGKKMGPFEENSEARSVPYPKGAFRWHQVGSVDLTIGKHKMRIDKIEVNKPGFQRSAAIIDAFYLTMGDERPKEK